MLKKTIACAALNTGCAGLLVALTGCGGGASFGLTAERDPYGGDPQFSAGVTIPFGKQSEQVSPDRTGIDVEVERRRTLAARNP